MLLTYDIRCEYQPCSKATTVKRSSTHPPPRFCSHACFAASRRGVAPVVARKYHFTEAMNLAIRRAQASKHGALVDLWRTDPRFQAAGITYAIVKRQAVLLGCIRSQPQGLWSPEEEAYASERLLAGQPADIIARTMARHGWHRTPGAIINHLAACGVGRRMADFLTVHALAQAMNIDDRVIQRWITRHGLPVHHYSETGRVVFIAPAALRKWLLSNQALVFGSAKPDYLWLVSLLVPQGAGDTADSGGEDDGGAWLNGEAVKDVAAAD